MYLKVCDNKRFLAAGITYVMIKTDLSWYITSVAIFLLYSHDYDQWRSRNVELNSAEKCSFIFDTPSTL